MTHSQAWRCTAAWLLTVMGSVAVHAAPTGPNIAKGKPTTVSSFFNGSTNGGKAVDGNLSTYWRTKTNNTSISEWIRVDLGSVTSISRVILKWNSYYATQYAVEVSSDNASWATVYSVGAENGGTDTIDFAASNARYVRLTSRAWNDASQRIRLNEIEVYADDAVAPPPSVSGTWSVVASANGNQTRNLLSGISVIDSNDIWAVGTTSNGTNVKNTLTERWNGSQWSAIPSPNPDADQYGSRNELFGVAASSSSDVWAVGVQAGRLTGNQRTLALHWDGASWLNVEGPNVANSQSRLNGITVLSSTDAWAVGAYTGAATNYNEQALVGRWNGSFWAPVSTPMVGEQSQLYGVTAISPNNVWAVGQTYDSAGQKPLVMRWNGTNWSLVTVPKELVSNVGTGLFSISAISANDIWAVGTLGNSNLTLRYNGTTWTVVPSPNDTTFAGMTNVLQSVTTVSNNDVWAVGTATRSVYGPGDSGRFFDYTTILHWNGSVWSMVPSPDPGTSNNRLFGVARVTANELWAVGDSDFSNSMTQRYLAQ